MINLEYRSEITMAVSEMKLHMIFVGYIFFNYSDFPNHSFTQKYDFSNSTIIEIWETFRHNLLEKIRKCH